MADGAAELHRLAVQLRKAEVSTLETELRRQQREAFTPLEKDVKAEAASTLPSGYAPIMANAVKAKVSVRKGSALLSARVYAKGKAEERDVREVNAGRLRHPVFGHRRRAWHVTRVRSGFVDRPFDRTVDRVVDKSADAAEQILAQIARG